MVQKKVLLAGVVLLVAAVLAMPAFGQKVTLNVIGNNHNNTLIFIQKILPKFEAETGMKVNVDLAGDSKMKALLDIKSKKGFYDIIAFDSSNLPEYIKAKVLSPLDDYINKEKAAIQWDDVINTGKGLATEGGKIYGMPSNIQIWMMMVNLERLSAAGLSGSPQTWDELVQYSAKLTNKDKKLYGFVTQPAKTYNSIVHSYWAFMVGFGGKRVTFKDPPKDWTPIINGPIPVETLKYLGNMMQYGPPGANTYAWGEAIASYAKGESAIYPIYSDAWNIFEDPTQSSVVGKSTMTSQPYYPGRPDSKTLPYGGWCWGLSPLSKNKDSAWKLLKWMVSPATCKDWTAQNGVPLRFSQLRDPAIQKQFPWAKIALERDQAGLVDTAYRPRDPSWPQIEVIFGEELSSYFTNAKTAEQAMNDGASRLKDYMIVNDYPVLSK